MAIENINVGATANDGTGDPLRSAFIKCNDNFTDLDTTKQDTLLSGTNIKTINSTSLLGSGNINLVPYTGAISDIDLGEFGLKTGNIELDTTPTTAPTTAGSIVWNDADGTADLILKGGNVTLQIGQESVIRVVNKTATNVNLLQANYQAVRITGAQGQRLKVDLAQATTDPLSAETIGLVTETINNNEEGFITTSGLVRGINTTGSLQSETWADGDILYLSPTTAGRVTKVKPVAPNHLVIIGYVISAHVTQGSIFVKVDNGYELDELHNVKIASATNGQALTYTSATDIWENKTIIEDAIVDAVTTKAPSQNAVFDALALKQNTLTNPITGTGTTNYISKFTGTSALGNSQIFDNGTKVGIGNTSPTEKLDVSGVIRGVLPDPSGLGGITGKLLSYSGSPYGIVFRGYAIGSHSIQVQREANDAEVYSLALQPIGGNVGIGTTTPTSKLQISGTFSATGVSTNLEVTDVSVSGNGPGGSGFILEDGSAAFGYEITAHIRAVVANYSEGVYFRNESGCKFGLQGIDTSLWAEGGIIQNTAPSNSVTVAKWIKIYDNDSASTYFIPVYQ